MKRTGNTKLLAHHHTGKIRHWKHTSYGSLALILLLTFIPTMVASRSVASAAAEDTASYATYGVVLGPTPKTAPTIANLTNGQTFTTSDPLGVEGTCPVNTLVKIFKNDILAGATVCQGGVYHLLIDLFVGNNSLVARAYNANDIVSPDSPIVSVQLNLPGSLTNSSDRLNTTGAPAGQFYITSEQYHLGANVGDTMTWPLTIIGGQSPYAVNVSWGDGKSDLISRSAAGQFTVSHVYSKPSSNGSDTVVVKATDGAGANAYLQLIAIASGSAPAPGIVGSVTGGYSKSTVIRTAWQLFGVSMVVVLSFWLGEKREAWILRKPHYGI
jgi:hypothetical protein